MMVCHCNKLTADVLRDAAAELALEPGRRVVTPGAVFRTAGCRPRCGGCFPLVVEVLHGATRGLPAFLDPAERPAAAHAHACADCPRAEHERTRAAGQTVAQTGTLVRPAVPALRLPEPANTAALRRAG